VEPGAGENLGEFHFSENRTEDLETPHEVTDEVGEPIHRFGQTDKRIGPFFIEAPHPGRNRERSYEKDPGGLSKGPTASCPKLENLQPRRRRIVGASVGFDLLHSGILDTDLLAEQLDFLM